ncbi:PAS domain S-box-containing protein [Halorubrum alkaliphilum]|uniref:PAS domain S-box-containing protein n=1 Tax=Halorubrum alkaliphilum TaxID=261290 RepID=A0A8T4GJS4_9EURY|nr:PAS domain S-box protein [Halorubrum alkaliphilum]MBP1923322.1 PAS domain S-box-containing protein [Halorubrum alkaliphilum]
MARGAPDDRIHTSGDGFFASFVEGCSDPVISIDDGGTIVYVSPATEDALGYDADDLVGRRLETLIPDDPDDGRVRSVLGRLGDVEGLADAGELIVPIGTAEGAQVVFSVRFHAHEVDDLSVHTGVFRDGIDEDDGHELRAFRNLVEHAGHAIYVTDRDGTIEYVNPAFTEHTGYEPEEVIGRTPAVLNSGEMPEAYFESLWDTIRAGEVYEEEVIDQRRDGSLYHAHQTIAPVLDDDGRVSRFIAIQTDVTHRKAAERRLKQYRDVVERLDDPILLQNLDGEFELLNEAVSEFAGLPREELYGTDESAFMDPETAALIEDRRREVLETEEPVEYETSPTFERSGREATFSTRRYPYYDADGELAGTLAVCRDVTNLKERATELERFERAVDGATDLIAAVDRNGEFLFANRRYRAYHGIDADDVTGLSLTDVIDGEQYPDVKRNVNRALRGHSIEYRTTRTHPDRGTRTFDVRYYPLNTAADDDEVGGVVGVLRDVTDSENRATQLRVVDRVLQHNLRNALTVIQGRAKQIAGSATVDDSGDVDDPNADAADIDSTPEAAEAASYILSRAEELLTTSEKAHHITEVLGDPADPEPTDVSRTVEQFVPSLAAEFSEATISTSTPGDGVAVASATEWLARALEELVRNAVIHHDRDRPVVDVSVDVTEDYVEVRITDDGPGLTEMNRDVLETGRAVDALYHGSGLGLWMVYWVLRQSGGSATVRDAEPRGTVVTVSLPRHEP